MVRDWEVLDDYTGSLHKYLVYKFSSGRHPETHPTGPRWSWRKLNREKVVRYINSSNVGEEAEPIAVYTALYRYLVGACDSCMPKGQYRRGKKPVYWWSSEIADLRSDCKKARRRSKRVRYKSAEVQEQCRSNFQIARNTLRKVIRDSKEACWKNMCQQVEKDPWGLPYKLVAKKLMGKRPIPGLSIPGG